MKTGICQATCPTDYKYNSSDRICFLCAINCEECSSEKKEDCSLCKLSYFLTSSFDCVDSCPGGYYGDTLNRVCVTCSPNCLSCTGSK